MSAASLIESIRPEGGPVSLASGERWLQGRTLYGGASSLVAYTAAVRAFPDLPPLRAAQIAFTAPLGTTFEIRREVIRRGRNVAVVRSELWSEGACGLSATWLFGTPREANARHLPPPLADWPGPPDTAESALGDAMPDFIAGNFDIRRAQDVRGPGAPVVRRWARLVDADGLDAVSQIILMGDVLPPGAIRAMQRRGPLSSMNWSFNLLEAEPATCNGWWLAEAASQHADHGYSSERLRLWSTDGRQVLDGMQCAAIFG